MEQDLTKTVCWQRMWEQQTRHHDFCNRPHRTHVETIRYVVRARGVPWFCNTRKRQRRRRQQQWIDLSIYRSYLPARSHTHSHIDRITQGEPRCKDLPSSYHSVSFLSLVTWLATFYRFSLYLSLTHAHTRYKCQNHTGGLLYCTRGIWWNLRALR